MKSNERPLRLEGGPGLDPRGSRHGFGRGDSGVINSGEEGILYEILDSPPIGDRTARNDSDVPTDEAAIAPPSDGASQPPEDLGPRPSWADKAWQDHHPYKASLGPLTGLCN
eukprot:scaffold723_cov333-Pavlova_lutheri.AAC.1